MKACKDIDFLDTYWKEAKRIADDVNNNLASTIEQKRIPFFQKGNAKMWIINYSELNTWNPQDITGSFGKRNNNLKALADKISYMIYKGRADSIKRMLVSICNDNVKKLTQPNGFDGEFLGYGHFRWNFKAYKLSELEIQHVKKFFKL